MTLFFSVSLHGKSPTCYKLFQLNTNQIIYKSFDEQFYKPNEIKEILSFVKSRQPVDLRRQKNGTYWENPIQITSFLAEEKGELKFEWGTFDLGVRYTQPRDQIYPILQRTIIEAVETLKNNFPEASELLKSSVFQAKVSIIRYMYVKGELYRPVGLHMDGEEFHATIVIEKPKRGTGGDLVIQSMNSPEQFTTNKNIMNRLNIFEGQNQFHGVNGFLLPTSDKYFRKRFSERIVVALFFSSDVSENRFRGYKKK